MIERDTPANVGAILPHDAYAALRHRDFRLFIVSLFTMVVGSQAQAVVVAWQIYAITHDPLSLGLIGLAEALPFIGIALPAGHVADRRNRRAISVAMLLVLALCSAALVALSATPGLSRTWASPGVRHHLRHRCRARHPSAGPSGTRRGHHPARACIGMPSPGAAARGRRRP